MQKPSLIIICFLIEILINFTYLLYPITFFEAKCLTLVFQNFIMPQLDQVLDFLKRKF